MPNSKDLLREIVSKIDLSIDRSEAEAIAFFLLDRKLGVSRAEVMGAKEVPGFDFEELVARINQHEPVQYVVGEEFFMDRIFKVNPSVLIPRPETEELVREVVQFAAQSESKNLKLLDIGTGSGCIAVSLAAELARCHVAATDKSIAALEVARGNAYLNQVSIDFFQHDILKQELPWSDLDIIVSNPPYIREKEAKIMNRNVTHFEPALALFVPNDDPLLFYKAIAQKSSRAIKWGGAVLVEINEAFGKEVQQVFETFGFTTSLKKDLSGKDRMIFAQWKK